MGWIFKIIWIPAFALVALCALGVAVVIFEGAGWGAPFRWLIIIAALAYLADSAVNP